MCVLRDSKDPVNACLSMYHYVMFKKLWSYLYVLLGTYLNHNLDQNLEQKLDQDYCYDFHVRQ